MNKKTLIIYNSKTGFTKRYAEWIQQELKTDLCPFKKRDSVSYHEYETLIFGSCVYAGQVSEIKWLKELARKNPNMNFVIFITGSTSFDSPEVSKVINHNFSSDDQKQMKIFYVRSGLCYEKMNFSNKLMMKMFCKMIKKSEGDSETYRTLSSSHDYSSKEYIKPLIEYVEKLN